MSWWWLAVPVAVIVGRAWYLVHRADYIAELDRYDPDRSMTLPAGPSTGRRRRHVEHGRGVRTPGRPSQPQEDQP